MTYLYEKILSPAAITGQVDNWAATNLYQAEIVRVALSGAAEITSMTGGISGRVIILQNTSTTLSLSLRSDDGVTGTAANRFLLLGGVELTLPPLGSTTLVYDFTSLRWRAVVAVPPAMLIITEAGATRTATNADNNCLILFTAAGGCTYTIPTGLGVGNNTACTQMGAAQVTIAAGGGMTLTKPTSAASPIVTKELGATVGVAITTSTTALVVGNLG